MSGVPSISLAASARDWSDRLHRFLLDHGGGIVVGRVMTADQAIHADADALLIDDVCSFLSPRLVVAVRDRGQAIIGVFDTDDGPDAKRRLLEVGISDVIDSTAPPEEFLRTVTGALAHLPEPVSAEVRKGAGAVVVAVTGPSGGVGVTEVAIGLALELSSLGSTALVDLNQSWPAVGQRLGLPVYPNLRSVVDLAIHEPDRTIEGIHSLGALHIIPGLHEEGAGGLPPADLATLVSALSDHHRFVVLDLGVLDGSAHLLLDAVSATLVVGSSDPVGVTRLTRVARSVRSPDAGGDVALVANRAPRGARQRDEVISHLKGSLGDVPIVMIPHDKGLERVSWDGSPPKSGVFRRRMRRLANVLGEVGV